MHQLYSEKVSRHQIIFCNQQIRHSSSSRVRLVAELTSAAFRLTLTTG